MDVIADASPLNYLILIERIELLPRLFGRVSVPVEVIEELRRPGAPVAVAQWASSPPEWILCAAPASELRDDILDRLDSGEKAAILLAEASRPDVLLVIDEIKGRQVAVERRIPIIGILGILEFAAPEGWLDLAATLGELQRTNFCMSERLLQSVLRRNVH